jgi:chorismate--pyruvate lyase
VLASNKNSALQWMPAERLGAVSIEPRLRQWLIGQGLLTARLRAVGGEQFRVRLAEQFSALLDATTRQDLGTTDTAALFREVSLQVGAATWVYAQSIIPDSTLGLFPWLAELGDSPLGETIGSMSGVTRQPYEFAAIPAAHPLALRVLALISERPAEIWARRAMLRLRGAPLIVQELFCPSIGQHASPHA